MSQLPHWAPPVPPQGGPAQPHPYAAYPVQTAPPPPRSPLVAVLVTALVAGLVGLLLGISGTIAVQSLSQDEAEAGDPDAGRTAAEVVPERVPDLVAWVQERTGETFSARPEVTVLPDDEFEDALLEPLADDAGEPQSLPTDDWTSTVAALGMVEDAEAYDRYEESGFAEGVVGFYDTSAEAIWLRDTTWGPSMEVTLVHELVHALQDQVVDLDAVTARTRYYDESHLALRAVIEGHATVVEEDWLAEQDESYVDEYWSDAGSGTAVEGEPLGDALGYLPYDVGWWGVLVLEEAVGPDATFEALREPPTTLEQLWDMESWVTASPSAADPVALPDVAAPEGAEVIDRGSLGVHLLSLLTLEPEEYVELPSEDELPLEGWAGDSYVTWEHEDGSCTRVQVLADDDAAAAAMADGLEEFGADGGTLRVEGNRVHLERCTT